MALVKGFSVNSQDVATPSDHHGSEQPKGGMKIELLHVSNCPHVDAARALLRECLTELQLEAAVEDKEGAYPSPTILVNGVDVMGTPAFTAAACRLDVPTKRRLLIALRYA